MTYSFFGYLVESSLCLLLFLAVHRMVISRLTHFSWIRYYLLSSVLLSLVLPLINIHINWGNTLQTAEPFRKTVLILINQPSGAIDTELSLNSVTSDGGMNLSLIILYLVILIYGIGVIFKMYNLIRNLRFIQKFIKQYERIREEKYWLVYVTDEVPAFSFFHYIFLNEQFKNLNPHELELVKNHEKVHAMQYHSLDILLIELTSVVCWFNPIFQYLKKTMQEVHEFIVDEKIVKNGESKKEYTHLLLNLASENKACSLSASFTGLQIKRRILMIAKPRSEPFCKAFFALIIPLTAFLMLSFSYIKNPISKQDYQQQDEVKRTTKLKVGEIVWKGNAAFSTDTLNKILGLKRGDPFYCEDLNACLNKDKILSLYMDNGYAFYHADFSENQWRNDDDDITIYIYEGIRGKIGRIIIKGNVTVPEKDIMDRIIIKPGELFNRSKIITSVKAIKAMGKFDPKKFKIRPVPDPEKATSEFALVDILIELTENK